MTNHTDQNVSLLKSQIGNPNEVADIKKTAMDVAAKWVPPVGSGTANINGLIYGLVQSGKTGVLTVTGAIGADAGYDCILILTSDNDPLYDQTLGRVQEAFPGLDILGKSDFKNPTEYLQRLKAGTCAIVATKNGSILQSIIDNLKLGKVKSLSCLIIDDEADQASLDTNASKGTGVPSPINQRLIDLRSFFRRNTYLQVTATPQALFLQQAQHTFRPKFTILSHPGADYVGGDDFFKAGSDLVVEFPLADITTVSPGAQPSPALTIPKSLLRALDTFVVAATFKRMNDPTQNCAFLCHVSTKKSDHQHLVKLLRNYKDDLSHKLKAGDKNTVDRLRDAHADLSATHAGIAAASFSNLVADAEFLSRGIMVKLVNGETDEDVAVRSPLNLFVGGNKLGRGVTIKNLLVSYYGRNPRSPQADTVLQHARMYGYRRKDIGLLRLFLPPQLNAVFQAINQMEKGLRDFIATHQNEDFRGLFIQGRVKATRRNVLAPGSVGVYTAGSSYNPAQVLRDVSIVKARDKIDALLASRPSGSVTDISVAEAKQLLGLVREDTSAGQFIWDTEAIVGSIEQLAALTKTKDIVLLVDRDRDLSSSRRETAGILSGGEIGLIGTARTALVMYRTKGTKGREAAWWPQVRFASGAFAFAFAV